MKSTRTTSFGLLLILFSLIFIASVFFLAVKLTASEAVWTIPVYIAVFILFFLLYFRSADLWLSRRKPWIRFGLTLVLLAPTLLLSIWLGLVKHNPISPLVWFAPFLGIAVGLNLRVALGRKK